MGFFIFFPNEDEADALEVLVRKYNYKCCVKVTQVLSKAEQRNLKELARELLLPLEE